MPNYGKDEIYICLIKVVFGKDNNYNRNKKERIFCSGFAGSKPAGLQKNSLCFNDKRLYEICQEPLFGKSRFQCRFISLAVPSGKYTFTTFLKQFYKYDADGQSQETK